MRAAAVVRIGFGVVWAIDATFLSHPMVFAVGTGIVGSLIALGLILGAFSTTVFIGSAVFTAGIWSAAEGFHLPWNRSGITDLGPSVGYFFASLALFLAAAGSVWSVDARRRAAKPCRSPDPLQPRRSVARPTVETIANSTMNGDRHE